MTGDMLSQDEINQLLNNSEIIKNDATISDSDNSSDGILSNTEKDTLGEIGNISMGAAATALSNILDRRVNITIPVVDVTTYYALSAKYERPCVAIHVPYVEGLYGDNILVIKMVDAKAITSLLIGTDEYSGDDTEINETHLSAISEVMNQMMGASATSLAQLVQKRINIAPPTAEVLDFKQKPAGEDKSMVAIRFMMEIEGLFKSEVVLLMDIEFSKEIVSGFFHAEEEAEKVENVTENKQEAPAKIKTENIQHNPAKQSEPAAAFAQQQETFSQESSADTVNVRSVQFERFDEPKFDGSVENIGLLMDVPLQVTVELGRTKRILKDVLELNIGSIVTLNKSAGETVDIVVNGKMIAKGEVVVVDDDFAVRITDIISKSKRA